VKYLISPPEDSSWTFDREALISALQRDWRVLSLGGPSPVAEGNDVTWRIETGVGSLVGNQHKDGQTQGLDGDLQAVARYAAWWREVVPDHQPLVLYDEGLTAIMDLRPKITENEVVVEFERAWDQA